MLVLDTNHLTVLGYASAASVVLLQRLNQADDEVVSTVISLEEQMRGWLAAINRTKDVHEQIRAYDRLKTRTEFLAQWTLLPWDADAAKQVYPISEKRRESGHIRSQNSLHRDKS